MKSSLLGIILLASGFGPVLGAPAIIAHRGASQSAPENTVASIRQAWKEGADGVEADFHLSSDGEVVCIHDPDTLRTTGVKKIVKETPWKELEGLDAGSWKAEGFRGEKIPRFADILREIPAGKYFFVEIKSGPATIAPVKEILASLKGDFDPEKIVIISFDPAAVAEARRLLPDHEAHLVSSIKEYGDAAGMEKLDRTIKECGANGFQFKYRPEVTSGWIESLKARGLKTDSWVINEVAPARVLTDLGIGFLTTDCPGPLRKQLEQTKSSTTP